MEKKTVVYFNRAHSPYGTGDIAAFEPTKAQSLIRSGVARPYEQPQAATDLAPSVLTVEELQKSEEPIAEPVKAAKSSKVKGRKRLTKNRIVHTG